MSIDPGAAAAPFSAPEVWLDDAPVTPGWAPPQGSEPVAAPAPARRVPAVLLYGVVLLALVLVVVAIWGLGGLKQRADVFRDVAVGARVSTGPYELSFTEATAQLTTDFDKTRYWKVTIIGTGRATGTATIAPVWSGNESMFVAKDSESQELERPTGVRFGGVDASLDRDAFTPGLGPIPYAVTFKFAESYRPGPPLRFIVYDLDFYDDSLLGDDDEAWHNGDFGSRIFLPVRVLPS